MQSKSQNRNGQLNVGIPMMINEIKPLTMHPVIKPLKLISS